VSATLLSLHPEFLVSSKTRRYLLAISGGRDSVALLHSLLDAGYSKLVLCHLNHALRGKESGQDAAFVRRLAKKHSLPYEIARVDVMQRAHQTGESMELAARNSRHAFFAQCAQAHRCSRVLLAHHADDQAETILFNLLRGSSGLKGMQYAIDHQIEGKPLQFIRPLLESSRSEINRFLTNKKISYRDDSSNDEAIATRNRFRNEAIPLLNEIMGREIRPALLRAALISEAQEKALQSALTDLQLEDPQGRLFLPKLIKLSPALRKIAMFDYLKKHDVRDISHDLLTRCLHLVDNQSIAKTNLPKDRFLRRKEKRLFID